MDTPTTGTGAGALIVLALSALVSSGLLGAVFVYFRKWVESRIGAQNTRLSFEIVGEAVKAAEQIGRNHGYDATKKYQVAIDRAATLLNDRGIYLDPDQLRTLVEGAVTQMKIGLNPPVVVADTATVTPPASAPTAPTLPSKDDLAVAIARGIGEALSAVYPQDPPAPVAPIAVQTVPVSPPTS